MKTKNRNMLPRCDRGNEALTMFSRPPLGTTGRICQKSPPRTMVFPRKIFLVAYASSNCIKSHRVRLIVSKVRQCIIGASSQMIILILCTNSGTFICYVMLQVNSSCRSIGILNLEWAILPPKNSKDAIPDEATISMILPCPRKGNRSVFQTNVLLVPPLPYTKNSLPSLFIMTFKIVLYAVRWSSLSLSSYYVVISGENLCFFKLAC